VKKHYERGRNFKETNSCPSSARPIGTGNKFALNRSRQWVYKWLKRHSCSPADANWSESHSNAPKSVRSHLAKETETAIINIRREFEANPYYQSGAVSISYKLDAMGVKPPSTSTINRVIKRNNLQNKSSARVRKSTEYPSNFINAQQMDLIGPCYLKGGFKFYFFSVMDVDTHYGRVYPIKNKPEKCNCPLSV